MREEERKEVRQEVRRFVNRAEKIHLPHGELEQADKAPVAPRLVQLGQRQRLLQAVHVVIAKGAQEGAVGARKDDKRQHPARVAGLIPGWLPSR